MQVTWPDGSSGGASDYGSCIKALRDDVGQLYEQLDEERALTRQKERDVIERDALVRDCEGQVGASTCIQTTTMILQSQQSWSHA